jgi:hypothetical protein
VPSFENEFKVDRKRQESTGRTEGRTKWTRGGRRRERFASALGQGRERPCDGNTMPRKMRLVEQLGWLGLGAGTGFAAARSGWSVGPARRKALRKLRVLLRAPRQ